MTLVKCSTPKAVLLCAVVDQSGVLRCPVLSVSPPGLMLSVQPVLPINAQLVDLAGEFFGQNVAVHLEIEQQFADPIVAAKGEEPECTLYLARLARAAGVTAAADWPTIPDILRSLSGRARVPYMRAWQVLAGGLQLNTKAVDAAEVAKYFSDEPT